MVEGEVLASGISLSLVCLSGVQTMSVFSYFQWVAQKGSSGGSLRFCAAKEHWSVKSQNLLHVCTA